MVEAIVLTLQLASLTTLILLIVGVPLGFWLARDTGIIASVVSALVALPLVLPPTVLGFYLLIGLGPNGPLAPMLAATGIRTLAFSFPGLVIGSVLFSLPFMVQPARNGFAGVGREAFEAAATLRAGPLDSFFSVALPLARGGVVTGAILSFAHTIGEFGVVLMIGGNIPGETRVLSIAIFDAVEQGDWGAAHQMSAGLLAFAFVVILTTTLIEKRAGGRAR
ncbi:MAG: molybdate ABC transporter permease subunit [Alphaproteobacteria bacterium]|nr:molybdate ABC transporter permease subunit [Alphaproteobacteria bacterium]